MRSSNGKKKKTKTTLLIFIEFPVLEEHPIKVRREENDTASPGRGNDFPRWQTTIGGTERQHLTAHACVVNK